jgi:formylglycine-generating enzyme required for sulfatase activity
MSNLPAIIKKSSNQPIRSMGQSQRKQIFKALDELEAYLIEARASGDPSAIAEIQRRMAELQQVAFDDYTPQVPQPQHESVSLPPPEQGQYGDSFAMHGAIAPGAQVGSGSVTADRIAGRSNIDAQHYVENQIIYGLDAVPGAELDPGRTVERTYLVRLIQLANRVPLGQLEIRAAGANEVMPEIRLDQIYVPLDTTQTYPAVGTANPGAIAPAPLMEAVIKHRRLIILGDPGCGKSTFMNYLTLCLAQYSIYPERFPLERLSVESGTNGQRAANWRYGPLIPIRVDLREFAQHISEGTKQGTCLLIWQYICDQLTLHNMGEYSATLKKLLCDGKCMVLFDGLDEVSDPTQRRLLRDAVADFAHTYGDARMIVTCRVLSYTDPAWHLSDFTEVVIAPLNALSVGQFIESWYGTLAQLQYIDQAQAASKAGQLRRAANHLFDLAQNPMLLTVMAVVHTYKGTLPRERARLYNDCVELLLWNWQRQKQTGTANWELGILAELETREERLISGLCEVAYHTHKIQNEGSGSSANITEPEIVRILRRYLDNGYGRAQRFCEYVEKEAGLLIARGTDASGDRVYAFPHRGFQEFLAARYLVTDREFSRQMATLALQGDTWREVLLLAIGHLVFNQHETSRPLDVIDIICRQGKPTSEAGWRAIWTAGEMLHIVGRSAAEADPYIGHDLVPRVTDHLTALVVDGQLTPVERAQAADILGVLGDPRQGVCTPPEMRRIEGGIFEVGPDESRCKVTLKPFMLSRYPITNAQFRKFVDDEGYFKRELWSERGWAWREKTEQRCGLLDDPTWGIDNRPVVGLTWHEAIAYTRWLAKQIGKLVRLPTEAEWERAAAGAERRRYPWGQRASDDTTNHREGGIGQTAAVGIFPSDVTPEGISDMGGNVWEWCSSLNADYPYRPGDGREDMDAAGARILRGGAFDSPRATLHADFRRPAEPHARVSLIGFRIAFDAD